ncbi:adenylate/guanylate cyclase domain-containing protein [Candidatus Woesearchaeota archaeon]|nr:adenylate/guanylate cyclase domain-containing protein [Candidatus Woesearchaeota archaeon]
MSAHAKKTKQRKKIHKAPLSGMRSILLLDIINYTDKIYHLSIAALDELHNHFDRLIKSLVKKYDGIIINKMGDAFLISFEDSMNAVHCAMEMQDAFDIYNKEAHEDLTMHIRISINKGLVLIREHDILGTSVNIAARINSYGEAGGVIISQKVYEELDPEAFPITCKGKKKLKGVEHPVQLYAIKTTTSIRLHKQTQQHRLVIEAVILLVFIISILALFFM